MGNRRWRSGVQLSRRIPGSPRRAAVNVLWPQARPGALETVLGRAERGSLAPQLPDRIAESATVPGHSDQTRNSITTFAQRPSPHRPLPAHGRAWQGRPGRPLPTDAASPRGSQWLLTSALPSTSQTCGAARGLPAESPFRPRPAWLPAAGSRSLARPPPSLPGRWPCTSLCVSPSAGICHLGDSDVNTGTLSLLIVGNNHKMIFSKKQETKH